MNTATHSGKWASSKLPTRALTSSLALSVGVAALSIAAISTDDVRGRGNPTQLPEGASPAGTVYECTGASTHASAHADDAATVELVERMHDACVGGYRITQSKLDGAPAEQRIEADLRAYYLRLYLSLLTRPAAAHQIVQNEVDLALAERRVTADIVAYYESLMS